MIVLVPYALGLTPIILSKYPLGNNAMNNDNDTRKRRER